MTSTPVNVQGFATGSVYGANRVQTTETKGDFSKIFESQKNVSEDVEETAYAEQDGEMQKEPQVEETKDDEVNAEINRAETDEKSTTVNETDEAQAETDDDLLNEESFTGEELEQMIAVLNSAVTNVKDMLMQELQLTEGELNELLQELELSDLDLLQLDNIKELVLQAVGAQDMTAVLTDEGLYSQIKNIENEFVNIMQDLQETLEVKEEDVPLITEQVEEYQNLQKNEVDKPITVEVETETQIAGETKVTAADKRETSDNGQNPMQENNAFTESRMMTGNTENVQSASGMQTTSYATAETENIMRQIMDHMNIRLTAETTELDMQLQPETLGTLQIKISAKEGIMTAQFTTASETVKGVLESQMIQLQQQLEQQNIKVEAIEVTVQAHAFESALEKGNEHQASEEETKKNRTRRIDLLHLDGTEELESEEQLLAEMMEANGNTVDYLV